MDETKKQELNKAIEVLKDFCNSNACQNCPMGKYNCNGYEYVCDYCNNPNEDCGSCPRNEARKREWERECERERRTYRGRGGVCAS